MAATETEVRVVVDPPLPQGTQENKPTAGIAAAVSGVIPDDDDQTTVGLLLTAASHGDMPGLKRLVNVEGVNPNIQDYDKRTALHLAASEGQLETCKFLVSKGAVLSQDRWQNTPLDDALLHNQDACGKFLQDNLEGGLGNPEQFHDQLLKDCADGNLESVARLVSLGVDPNFGDYDKRTPLHLASSEGRLEIVRFLLEKGADAEMKDRWGNTPFDDAQRHSARTGANDIRDVLQAHIYGEGEHVRETKTRSFVFLFGTVEIILIILFWTLTVYADDAGRSGLSGVTSVVQLYPFFQDIHVMIFIGFGFLMTFLRKYGYSSVGYNFLVSVLCLQWHILVNGFFEQAFHNHFERIKINIVSLIFADFATASVLITFGALLGKVSPNQLLFVGMLEIVFFAINENIGLLLGVADVGGSMVIHAFGAYFGLAASKVLSPKKAFSSEENAANYRSDLFAMIGTIFLWLYWPSFNSVSPGAAIELGEGNSRVRGIVNTVLSLCASCMGAFLASNRFRHGNKISMVDIQNASLAGGVAVGTAANMLIHPGGAITIGFIAGVLSVVGYVFIQPKLEAFLGLHDTCGVNNLHGMPGILAALAGCVAASMASPEKYGSELTIVFGAMEDRTGSQQAGIQIAFLFITLAIAILGGTLTGFVAKLRFFDQPKEKFFQDDVSWEVPELETPYYFDVTGEVDRKELSMLVHRIEALEEKARAHALLDE